MLVAAAYLNDLNCSDGIKVIERILEHECRAFDGPRQCRLTHLNDITRYGRIRLRFALLLLGIDVRNQIRRLHQSANILEAARRCGGEGGRHRGASIQQQRTMGSFEGATGGRWGATRNRCLLDRTILITEMLGADETE